MIEKNYNLAKQNLETKFLPKILVMSTYYKSIKLIFIGLNSFFFLTLCLFSSSAQQYHTVRVNGTILLVERDVELQRGTVFGETDSLVFKTYNSLATVVHPAKGRFILRPDNVDLAYAKASYTPAMSNIKSRTILSEEFAQEYEDIDLSNVKASFTPAITNVSSRSSSLMSLNDLQNHFHGSYAIIDDIKLHVNPEIFPMTAERFFFIRYELDRKPVFKKLDFEGDTLIIDSNELLSVDGKPVPDANMISEMEVWYMERNNDGNITYIGTFEPVFPEEKQLFEEVSIILEVFADKCRDERLAEILSYINEFYGKPNKRSVELWLGNKSGF